MIKEAENIILNKEYFELSEEELATVSELVQNAEEYEEMKWFLASTQQALVSDKIQATPELKQKVMDHLNQPKDDRKFWLNGVVVFLFPEDKKFYQKPAFQMSLAALLIIGFLMVYDKPLEDTSMAINDTKEEFDPALVEESEEIISTGGEDEAGEAAFSTIAQDSVMTERDKLEKEETALEQPVIVYDMVESEPMMEVDEVVADELPQDGYYEGPVEEIEEMDDMTVLDEKNKDAIYAPAGSSGVTSNQTKGNNNVATTTSGDVMGGATDKSSIQTEKLDRRNNSGKKKLNSNNRERFSAKKSNESRNAITDSPVQDLDAEEGSSNKPEVNLSLTDQEKKGEMKEQQDVKIRSYELHVNETKELKSLFGTFK
jgi:hypothetical protein